MKFKEVASYTFDGKDISGNDIVDRPDSESYCYYKHVYPHPINIRDGDQVREWNDKTGYHTEIIRKDGTVEVIE